MSYFFGNHQASSFLGSKSGTFIVPDPFGDFSSYGNLVLDLAVDPSRLSLSGNKVIAWRDIISGKSATDSNNVNFRPTYTPKGLNGKDVISFDGTNVLQLTNLYMSSGSFTVFFVIGITNAYKAFFAYGPTWYGYDGIDMYGTGYAIACSRSNPSTVIGRGATNWHPNTPCVISGGIEVTSGNWILNVNKNPVTTTTLQSGTYAEFTNTQNLYVGGLNLDYPEHFFNGQMARFLIFANSPFKINVSAIENKLLSIYRL